MDDLTKSLNELLYYDHEEFQKSAAYNEGNKDGRKEIAKKLLNTNLTKEQIQKAMDLALEEILKLENSKD